MLLKPRFFNKSLPLALLVLKHRPLNFITALLSIALAAAMILSQWGFRDALLTSSVSIMRLFQPDLVMVSPQSVSMLTWMTTFPESLVDVVKADPMVQAASTARIAYMRWSLGEQRQARLLTSVGIDINQKELLDRHFSEKADILAVPMRILFDSKSRSEYGNVVELLGKPYPTYAYLEDKRVEVAGLVNLGVSFGADANAVMSRETFEDIIPPSMNTGEVELGLIKLKDNADKLQFLREWAPKLPDQVSLVTPQAFIQSEKDLWDQSKPIGFIFTFGVAMSLLIGSAVLFLILNMIFLLHIDDFATLMALGYSRRRLQFSIFNQSLILTAIGYPLGYIISEIIYTATRKSTNLDMSMEPKRVLVVFGFILCSSAISGALALRRLNEYSPSDAFR